MKTIEEKAKAYDEAIKVAENIHRFSSDLAEIKRIEQIFPELKESKESEDEKIKGAAIEFVRQNKSFNYRLGISKEEVIAWLEKQGKRDARNKYLEELLEADTIYQMAMNDAMVEEAKNKAIKALQELAVSKLLGLEKQGEQKPAEEYNITGIKSRNAQGKLGEMIKNLKPAEWSEEDELMLNDIITCNERRGYITAENIAWLKSLKDRCTLKPSKEQIKALEHFVRSVGESGYASPYDNNTKLLYSLLEQLKKLKG